MSKINILSSKIYNRISAGEVIDRPYSVVKELVENSIDAGAKNISIEIENGGLSSIKIVDDGLGIEKTELEKSILPHATSKISKVEDLENISSLGFRGEALASIVSVAKVTINSKPQFQQFGGELVAEGGDIISISDSASSNGTEITVNNLFYNAPVRAKFLRSERSEENEISTIVARFILSHEDISFKLISNGKVLLQSFGDGFESVFINIYGIDALNNCFFVDTEKNGVKIKGYLGKHHFTKSNRSYQNVFLNGRYIVNQTISSAIMNAYSSYLMKRQYPVYALVVEVPVDVVDVNVHPNKIDVRFINNQIIYSAIYSVVSKVLDGTSEAVNIIKDNPQINHIQNNQLNTDKNQVKYDRHNMSKPFKFDGFVLNDSGTKNTNLDFKNINDNKTNDVLDIFAENKKYIEELEKKRASDAQNVNVVQESIEINKELKLVGQALNTFLILEDGTDLYFIDQHAGHERLLFDRINKSINSQNIPVQPLLVSYILSVNNAEYEFLLGKLEFFRSIGIDIDEYGNNSFKIYGLPLILTDIDLDKFFKDILSDLNELRKITINDILKEKIALKACKSAIKAGDKLDESEIKCLLNMLNGNLGLKCPHGRPVAIKITRSEIDKWFKRIV